MAAACRRRSRGLGVGRQVEAWGTDIPEGKATDFRKAVDAQTGENVVFAWFEYPDRKARDAANQAMMSDPKMEEMSKDVPFDAKRMIFGGFEAVVEEGSGGGQFVDGIVVPVPEGKRDEYRRLAGQNAKVFTEFGATRVIETIGDDVPHGKVTDFYRAVKAEEGETSLSRSSNGPTRPLATKPGGRSCRTSGCSTAAGCSTASACSGAGSRS